VPVFVHVPFTTLDLLNLKHPVGSYRENPDGLYQLLETIMLAHNPNWRDTQALLNTFLTEEKAGIRQSKGGMRKVRPMR